MASNLCKLVSSVISRKVYLRRWRHLSPIIGSVVLMLADDLKDVATLVDNLNPVVNVMEPVKLSDYDRYVQLMDNLFKKLA